MAFDSRSASYAMAVDPPDPLNPHIIHLLTYPTRIASPGPPAIADCFQHRLACFLVGVKPLDRARTPRTNIANVNIVSVATTSWAMLIQPKLPLWG